MLECCLELLGWVGLGLDMRECKFLFGNKLRFSMADVRQIFELQFLCSLRCKPIYVGRDGGPFEMQNCEEYIVPLVPLEESFSDSHWYISPLPSDKVLVGRIVAFKCCMCLLSSTFVCRTDNWAGTSDGYDQSTQQKPTEVLLSVHRTNCACFEAKVDDVALSLQGTLRPRRMALLSVY